MKVAELKQVVDSNAVEMRENFAKIDENFARVDERFAKIDERFARIDERFEKIDERFEKIDERFEQVDDNFTDMRREMRGGFAVLERRIEESRKDMSHQIGVMMEKLMDHVAIVAEQKVEDLIDRKIKESEARAERKFVKRSSKMD